MNYGHLERIPVTLTVKSPLYIGSGEKLTAMEYILDDRNTVYVPSIPAMIDAFSNAWQRGLSDDFLRFIMAPGKSKKLGDFIRQRRISLNPLPKWVRYTVQAQRDIRGMNTFLTFIKNPDGQAYIPGSSIKGALRTALIAARINDADKVALDRELRNNPTARWADGIEQVLRILPLKRDQQDQVDRKNAVNDLLKAIEISDSAPFPDGALTVCCRHWLSASGEERQSRSPIYMECLRPGIQTRFYLTVDHSLWPEGMDAVAILRLALTEWDALCHRAHQDYFRQSLADLGTFDGERIVLGGGTGFHRKSLVYKTSHYPEQAAQLAHEVLRRQFTRNGRCTYKPPQGARTAPYLFKAARYEGAYYPLGVCELRL